VSRPAPVLGEHTREVLCECGYSDEDIARLEKDGTVVIAESA
jgi:crotonobetainyl-CoA:carnitine CoA-transferase CaiB-like acyl-CoA transferase